MLRTTIVKFKDADDKERLAVFGDLAQLYDALSLAIEDAEKVTDLADTLFQIKRTIQQSIEETLTAAAKKTEAGQNGG